MAVEARHLCLFPSQVLANRETVNGIDGGNIMGNNNSNMYGEPLGYGLVLPPMYGTSTTIAPNSIPVKTPMQLDSGLTYSIPVAVSRKRPRDVAGGITNPHRLLSFPANINSSNLCGSVTFLGEDISFQIHQQQLEVDQLIAQHTAKVRREIEDQRKSFWRRITRAVEQSMMKKLRAKEEEMENIGKLNWALEEKVKSLCVENQIWRELAESNEATANALRSNLEQVLAQAHVRDQNCAAGEGLILVVDDAQSCCGSNNLVIEEEEEEEEEERRTWVEHDNGVDGSASAMGNACGTMNKNSATSSSSRRLCRNCRKEEASVLVLPCRHLCLCYVCGPALRCCPICLSTYNATLHINSSSSSSSSALQQNRAEIDFRTKFRFS